MAALVLAAGRSSRMLTANKLLIRDSEGWPMVARVAAACVASQATQTVIVLGHQADLVREAVRQAKLDGAVSFAYAPDYIDGLSATLRAGIASLPDSIDGAAICLGDMPLVRAPTIDLLIEAFEPGRNQALVPCWKGVRGNPVLWSCDAFPDLLALSGDQGARSLLSVYGDRVKDVPADTSAVLADFDTPASLHGTTYRIA